MTDSKTCSCGSDCAASSTATGPSPVTTASKEEPWFRSSFRVPGMDCPAEEQMIRLCLSDLSTNFMRFDLPGRNLVIGHAGDVRHVIERLKPLGYGAELLESRPLHDGEAVPVADDVAEAKVLWLLLGVNALMFAVEMVAGWWAGSAGLISDAADMFADAAVYGVAIYAVNRDSRQKLLAAKTSGLLQLLLAVTALSETSRRVFMGGSPEELTMVGMSLLALAANVWCLSLISRHRDKGVHMQASYIFSANDVLANLGVILAGLLVAWLGSPLPDWIIGFAIGVMLLVGSVRILRLR